MKNIFGALMYFTDKKLAEKIVSCQYIDPGAKNEVNIENTFIDLAKLSGIRKTLLNDKNDTLLSEDEMNYISRFWDWDKRCRMAHSLLLESNEGNYIYVEDYDDCPTGILRWISIKTPDIVYKVLYNIYVCDEDKPRYCGGLLKNGTFYSDKQITCDSDAHEDEIDGHSVKEYEDAIKSLSRTAEKGSSNACYNIGVCYEKLGNYELAAHYYRKSYSNVAIANLLKLFHGNYLGFENEEYLEKCDLLIERNEQNGYLFKSYIFQNNKRGLENQTKAFEILEEGITKCKKVNKLIFEIAHLYEIGYGVEKNDVKAHTLYKTLLGDNAVAEYNYALQYLNARGCNKDISEAISWLIHAANSNYIPAIKLLIEIYTNDKRLKNKKTANKYMRKLKKYKEK